MDQNNDEDDDGREETNSEAVRDWENLPGLVVVSIVEKLSNPVDFTSFSRTGRAWRQEALHAFTFKSFLSSLPPLIFWIKDHRFHDLPHRLNYRLTNPTSIINNDAQFWGFSHGHLIFCDHSIQNGIFLVNPFTRNEIRGFHVIPPRGYVHAVLTLPPSNPHFVLVLSPCRSIIKYCRRGDRYWSEFREPAMVTLISRSIPDGKVKAFGSGGRILTVDFASRRPVVTCLLPTGLLEAEAGESWWRYAVESNGELLMLYFRSRRRREKGVVYKLDVDKEKWVRMEGLGGRSLFVSGQETCLVEDPWKWGFRGNCVYFFSLVRWVGVLPLADGSKAEYIKLLPLSSDPKPYDRVPFWILPSLSWSRP